MCRLFVLLLSCILLLSSNLYPQYYGVDGGEFDQSPNGNGWASAHNRKVQTFDAGYSGEFITALYRKLDSEFGTGVIGGMSGDWQFSDSPAFYADTVYTHSLYQSSGNAPGARYPFACGLINMYIFGIFNDFDVSSDGSVSQPMYTVGDATLGWNNTIWMKPQRIESSDSSYAVQGAWCGTGDVVYDPESGYYYWVTGWSEDLTARESPISCAVGRTKTPSSSETWIWSDYRDLRFDLDCIVYTKDSDYDMMSEIQFAYAKDRSGNGTGKGIGVAVTRQSWTGVNKLSYTYTTNWGADSLSGVWRPNWIKGEFGLQHVSVNDLFDWVGETITINNDSIIYNLNNLEVFADSATVTADYPYILWNVSPVVTEDNIVHILCMVFPASIEYPNCILPWTDSGFRAGYYDITGEITDAGVNWFPAEFIANPVNNDKGWLTSDGGMEFVYGLNRSSLSYLGNNRFLAAWPDKPESDAVMFEDFPENEYLYIDDGYLIYSDNGSWIPGGMVFKEGMKGRPSGELTTAANVTNTPSLFENGWSIAGNGRNYDSYWGAYTYAVCQYYDHDGTEIDYQARRQFLHIWKTGFTYSGIEPEEVSLPADFELYQNYPNPFNPITEIRFSLAENSKVNLSVYNTNGQLIRTLLDGKTEKGSHAVNFDASELNSGMYFYKLDVNGKVKTKKMLMLK